MKTITSALAVLLTLAACAQTQMPASTAHSKTAAQTEIETGLVPAVVFKGDDYSDYTLANRQAAFGIPDISVAIARGGKIAWAEGYGEHTNSETLFQAASLSKAVASAGIIALAFEQGISLDEDLTPHLKTFDLAAVKPEGVEVTLRGLLSHTAGATVSGFPGYSPSGPIPTNLEVLQGSDRSNTDPVIITANDTQAFRYSGGGYQIAQAWAEEASGEDFAALMDRLVLQPVGMNDSMFTLQPEGAAASNGKVAKAYAGGGSQIEGGWHVYPEQAAAGLWTTASDYTRFMLALIAAANGDSDAGIAPSVAREITAPVSPDYGLGMGILPVDGEARWLHSGSNRGYRTTAIGFPERGDAIVVLTNKPQGFVLLGEISRAAYRTYGWPDTPRKEIERFAMTSEHMSQFEGAYAVDGSPDPLFDLTIRRENLLGHLRSSGRRFTLVPISENAFIDPEENEIARFEIVDGQWVFDSGGKRYVQLPRR